MIESDKWTFLLLKQSFFTDSSAEKYFQLLNQLIFTEIISEFRLIRSSLFLAIWNSQISLIISRFDWFRYREEAIPFKNNRTMFIILNFYYKMTYK